jgi:hypothetical protein
MMGPLLPKTPDYSLYVKLHRPLWDLLHRCCCAARWLWDLFRWCCRPIGWLWCWVFSSGLEPNSDGKASALGQLVTLQGIFWTSTLALVAYVQKAPDFELSVLAVYVVLAILPIGGVFILFRARQDAKRLLFDQGTRMFGKWVLASTLFAGTAAGIAYSSHALPGQGPLLLPVSEVEPRTFDTNLPLPEITVKAGDKGLRAYVPFSPLFIGKNHIPDRLVIDVSLTPRIKNWQITGAKGYVHVYTRVDAKELPTDKPPTDKPPTDKLPVDVNEHYVDVVDRNADSTSITLHWKGLTSHDVYLLQIGLHQKEGVDGVALEELSAMIKEDRDGVLIVKTYFRE